MPFDSNIQGYLSAVETLEDIWAWFTPEDVDRLTEYGYRILEYRSDDYKFYNGHWLINQCTSVMQRIFPVNDNISHPGDSMPCTISDWSCEYHACMSDDCQRDHVLMSGHDWGSGACKIADMNDYRNMSDQTLS